MATLKNSRIDQSDSRSQKKHRDNQSDGVMLVECWSSVDCLHVISMAPIDLLAHPDLTDQLKETKEGEEEKEEETASRWQAVGWKSYLTGVGDVGFDVAGYSIKTRADVTLFHCILDRCSDLCFVILARACLSARASFPFPPQPDCLSRGHWTITQSNPLQVRHEVYQLQVLIQK